MTVSTDFQLPSLPQRRGEGELLKRTTSRCPDCLQACPAEVWKVGSSPARVELRRTCAEHGPAMAVISSDARFYWLASGDPQNACCGGQCSSVEGARPGTLGSNAVASVDGTMEKLSTCLALIEIVHSCNLACPTCYADSPVGAAGTALNFEPLEGLKARIDGIIDRKGRIEILQFSGGEPTLHPQFFELLTWAMTHPGIDYIVLNTNGVRLARDDAFAAELNEKFIYGKLQLYLQFDGPALGGQLTLRGADLRAMRDRAIQRCKEINLPVTLAMTVTSENVDQLWATIELGLQHDQVRGVSFQPMFVSGRQSMSKQPRLNTADIILGLLEQSRQKLTVDDFTPLPCGDPNCATIGYLLKTGGGECRSMSEFIDYSTMQGFLQNKIRYKLEDLSKCGCESEPLGKILHDLEIDESHTFRIFIKPFMDAWSWDQDRIDRCCTHVIRPDGKLDSFCRYYSGFPDARQ